MSVTRRRFLGTSTAAALAAGLLSRGVRAQDAPETTLTPIRMGLWTYEGQGGTIGLFLHDDAVMVIDAQFPPTATKLVEDLRTRTSEGRIDVLFNTHHHQDHTRGNEILAPLARTHVAHANVPEWQKKQATERNALTGQVYASTLYEDEWTTELGPETVRATYQGPAHTSGDSILHFENANVVHMGDLVFNRFPPFIDRPAGATIAGWMELLEGAHRRFDDDTVFIFGHGRTITGDRTDLLHQRDFLNALLDHARTGVEARKSEDEVASIQKLPGFEDHYREDRTQAIPNGLRVAYRELTEG